MCGPTCCSMKITGVRDCAAEHGVEAAIPEGMCAKAEPFRDGGGELYQEV